jgi:hypothetical protein
MEFSTQIFQLIVKQKNVLQTIIKYDFLGKMIVVEYIDPSPHFGIALSSFARWLSMTLAFINQQ